MIYNNVRMSSLLDLLVFSFTVRCGVRVHHQIPNSPQSQNLHPLKEKYPNHPQDPHKPKPPTKRNSHLTPSRGGTRNNVKFPTPLCDEATLTPKPQGALAHEDLQNDQRPLPQVKKKPQNHAKCSTPCETPIPDPGCFLCFSKESKTIFHVGRFCIPFLSGAGLRLFFGGQITFVRS